MSVNKNNKFSLERLEPRVRVNAEINKINAEGAERAKKVEAEPRRYTVLKQELDRIVKNFQKLVVYDESEQKPEGTKSEKLKNAIDSVGKELKEYNLDENMSNGQLATNYIKVCKGTCQPRGSTQHENTTSELDKRSTAELDNGKANYSQQVMNEIRSNPGTAKYYHTPYNLKQILHVGLRNS